MHDIAYSWVSKYTHSKQSW